MKNFMKKMLAVCVVTSVSAVAFGCSDGNDTTMETISLEDTKQELAFIYKSGLSEDSTEAAEDPTDAPTEAENTDSTVPAEPATEIVEVTDEAGETMTEAGGAVMTEVVTVPVETGDASQSSDDTTEPAKTHTPSYDVCNANWLDMSQAGDYFFNGEFLIIEFEVKEDLPDGYYPVSIYKTDIASWELVTHTPTCIDGGIVVGDAEAEKQPSASGDAFTLTVDNVTANAGDTVKMAINLENNPGFCGFLIDIQYDAAALTIVDAYGGADFDAAVNVIQ